MEVNSRSNEFQKEYIEYLKERNTELLDRLNQMKETYENKILSKDLSKHYLTSVLENVLNVCTVFPQEIDSFFDKMTAAMSALKNILLRKSEMEQLVDKILKAMNPSENFSEFITINDSSLVEKQSLSEKATKKAEIKVSPMIDGHIISTEPKIYLSRVPGVYTSCQRNEAHHLSPIIEASPESSSEKLTIENHVFKTLKIPLERVNSNKLSNNYINEESPRSRFKGPKTWKKSLFSNKCQSNDKRNSVLMENNENINKKLSGAEAEMPQLPKDLNPLEGPSWLYQDNSEINASCHHFVDYKRRKHRFAIMFDSNEDCVNCFDENRKSLSENSEFSENQQESDDEKTDFGSIGKKTRASSEDLIGDSIASEDDNSNTPLKKNQNSKRWSGKESGSKNDITSFHKNIKSKKKRKSLLKTPVNSDSCDEGDNQENSDRIFRKSGKSYRSSLGRPKNVFVKLEDCMATMETLCESTNTNSSTLKRRCAKNSQSKTQPITSVVFPPDTEGRKKRKAAPSFKLTEPRLNSKLRRN